jgi:hypothetical protein
MRWCGSRTAVKLIRNPVSREAEDSKSATADHEATLRRDGWSQAPGRSARRSGFESICTVPYAYASGRHSLPEAAYLPTSLMCLQYRKTRLGRRGMPARQSIEIKS